MDIVKCFIKGESWPCFDSRLRNVLPSSLVTTSICCNCDHQKDGDAFLFVEFKVSRVLL